MANEPASPASHANARGLTTLALAVITLDEERNIDRCLASVTGLAGEIVVVDSGSSDRTREIAEEAGASVFVQEFSGYGAQKQIALEKTSARWILSLDADEWLDDEARAAIEGALRTAAVGVNGFRLRRRTLYLGEWVDHGEWQREWKLRLVRRGCARWSNDVVHERLELTSGRCETLPGRILHEPYRTAGEHLETIDRYTDIISLRDRDTPAARVWFGIVLEPPLVFLHKYVVQLGFLDGWRGLVGAALTAYYFFRRYAKIWKRRG